MEVDVQDRLQDIQFLHNETMLAVAQRKIMHIYMTTVVLKFIV